MCMWVCQGSGLGLAQALSQDAWIRPLDERLGCTCPSTLLRPTAFLAPSAGPHKRGTNQTIKVIFQGSRDLRRGQRFVGGGFPVSLLSPVLPSAQPVSQALGGIPSRSFPHTHLHTHPQPGWGGGSSLPSSLTGGQ